MRWSGWHARHCATNVVRHSRAHFCLIRISYKDRTVHVEIVNDGYHEQKRAAAGGSGLAGLVERIATLGGQIEAGPLSTKDTPCFRLWVELPIRPSMTTEGTRRP